MDHEGRKLHVKVRKDIEAFMKSLGSTASEIQVFTVLYRARKYLTVKDIEEKVKLSSKGIRIALKRLEERGLVVVKEREGKKYYQAVPLKKVIEMWKERVEKTLSNLFRRPGSPEE